MQASQKSSPRMISSVLEGMPKNLLFTISPVTHLTFETGPCQRIDDQEVGNAVRKGIEYILRRQNCF